MKPFKTLAREARNKGTALLINHKFFGEFVGVMIKSNEDQTCRIRLHTPIHNKHYYVRKNEEVLINFGNVTEYKILSEIKPVS